MPLAFPEQPVEAWLSLNLTDSERRRLVQTPGVRGGQVLDHTVTAG